LLGPKTIKAIAKITSISGNPILNIRKPPFSLYHNFSSHCNEGSSGLSFIGENDINGSSGSSGLFGFCVGWFQ
jgi:hypothetical protein